VNSRENFGVGHINHFKKINSGAKMVNKFLDYLILV